MHFRHNLSILPSQNAVAVGTHGNVLRATLRRYRLHRFALLDELQLRQRTGDPVSAACHDLVAAIEAWCRER